MTGFPGSNPRTSRAPLELSPNILCLLRALIPCDPFFSLRSGPPRPSAKPWLPARATSRSSRRGPSAPGATRPAPSCASAAPHATRGGRPGRKGPRLRRLTGCRPRPSPARARRSWTARCRRGAAAGSTCPASRVSEGRRRPGPQ